MKDNSKRKKHKHYAHKRYFYVQWFYTDWISPYVLPPKRVKCSVAPFLQDFVCVTDAHVERGLDGHLRQTFCSLWGIKQFFCEVKLGNSTGSCLSLTGDPRLCLPRSQVRRSVLYYIRLDFQSKGLQRYETPKSSFQKKKRKKIRLYIIWLLGCTASTSCMR